MYRILVVDDEENIREVIKEYAEFEGHQVSEACDGMQAIEMVKNNDYDIIIIDLIIPLLDGYSAGIDDYVVKPFSPKEVMARVNAIVKRNQGAKQAPAAPAPETVKFGGLEINFTSRDVYIDGVKANLTPKEYDLLFYLVRNKNIALTRNKLLEEVWGYDFFGDDRTIDTHIKTDEIPQEH